MHHHHNHSLVVLSIIIAIFASYTSLDLVNSLTTSKGRIKWVWLFGGSLAMGVGIWSMHFIGMLAFKLPGLDIYYDLPLLLLSVLVAIVTSALALYIIANKKPSPLTYTLGSLIMGGAIAGMHYIGIASMRLAAHIHWNHFYVFLSILVAIGASSAALILAFKLREDLSLKGFIYRGMGGVLMGLAIAGMHYTAMAAMSFTLDSTLAWEGQQLLATNGLAAAVIIGTLIILGIALSGSNIDRALSKRTLLNEILHEGIRSRDEFLSIASHELKTPLTSVKLQLQLIARQLTKDDFDKEKLITTIKKTDRNIGRIDHLVEDMLDISRIRAGKLSLTLKTADLNDIIMEATERFPGLKYTPHSVTGTFDAFRIEQVLNNLISNALKYGQGGDIEIDVKKKDNKALISVKDYGLGIPPEAKNKIFDRFERAVKASEISGLGLGLYIVKEIVHAHRGRIWFESEIGKGTTFFVEIPLLS